MYYRCRKYYHSVNNHTKAMTLVTAYSFYNECCDGNLDEDWSVPVDSRMTKKYFQQRLGEQMMQYDPSLGLFPGDENTRPYIQVGSRRRNTSEFKRRKRMKIQRRAPTTGPLAGSISRTTFEAAVNSGRLTSSFPQLQKHVLAKTVLLTEKKKPKSGVRCFVCGEKTKAIVLIVVLDPPASPCLFVISIVSRSMLSTEKRHMKNVLAYVFKITILLNILVFAGVMLMMLVSKRNVGKNQQKRKKYCGRNTSKLISLICTVKLYQMMLIIMIIILM